MSMKIREICGDYALDIKYNGNKVFSLFFNSYRNALTVKRILEVDASVPNAATVADFVEVVRCKDCEHKVVINNGRVMCNRNAVKARFYDDWYGLTATDDNHFCSYGKRKEGAENG